MASKRSLDELERETRIAWRIALTATDGSTAAAANGFPIILRELLDYEYE